MWSSVKSLCFYLFYCVHLTPSPCSDWLPFPLTQWVHHGFIGETASEQNWGQESGRGLWSPTSVPPGPRRASAARAYRRASAHVSLVNPDLTRRLTSQVAGKPHSKELPVSNKQAVGEREASFQATLIFYLGQRAGRGGPRAKQTWRVDSDFVPQPPTSQAPPPPQAHSQ